MEWKITNRAAPLIALLVAGLVSGCHKNEKSAGDRGAPTMLVPIQERLTKVTLLLDTRHEPLRLVQMNLLSRLAQLRAGIAFKCLDAEGGIPAQRQVIEQAAAGDFLVVFPIDLPAITDALTQAKHTGAKVIVLDGATPPDACTTAIFCDETKVGAAAGEMVLQALRQRAHDEGSSTVNGRIVILHEEDATPALQLREAAFIKTLSAEPGAVLVHDAPVDTHGVHASARLAEALRLQKNFDVIFADTDLIAGSASTAILAAGGAPLRENMLILGVDGVLGKGGGVDMIIGSRIDATILRPLLVDTAWAVIEKLLDDPAFTPHAHYELDPQPVNLETALRLGHDGLPPPNVD